MTRTQRVLAKKAFLKTYAKTGIKSDGLRAAGVSFPTLDWWIEHDSKFTALMQAAERRANDTFRREIARRGRDGVRRKKPIYYQGDLVGYDSYKEYSDSLLIFEAKARMPEYREKISADATGTIRIEVVTVPLPGTSFEEAPVDGEYRALPAGST